MAVLEEVVAEMFRLEQEAIEFRGRMFAKPGISNMTDSALHRELAFSEEVVEEDIAGIGCDPSGGTQFRGLIALYDDTDDIDDMTIPYEGFDDDDDDGDFSDVEPRFIDYGWDAECLQNIEDIDFEFVYALHTFVATVEGQANATKGDTMVLLDDSNSYWWLVRVVKDSSIGECLTDGPLPCPLLTDGSARLSTRRTYRDSNREIGPVKQAP